MTAAKKIDAAEPPKAESGIRPKRAEGVPSFILHGGQFGAPEEIRTLEPQIRRLPARLKIGTKPAGNLRSAADSNSYLASPGKKLSWRRFRTEDTGVTARRYVQPWHRCSVVRQSGAKHLSTNE